MSRVSVDELAAGLRAAAKGDYGTEAAVELLVGHGRWLERAEFGACCYHAEGLRTSRLWRGVEWSAVAEVVADPPAASTTEVQVLALAVELAGQPTGRPLGDLLCGLEDRNSRLVADAVAHVLFRGGHR